MSDNRRVYADCGHIIPRGGGHPFARAGQVTEAGLSPRRVVLRGTACTMCYDFFRASGTLLTTEADAVAWLRAGAALCNPVETAHASASGDPPPQSAEEQNCWGCRHWALHLKTAEGLKLQGHCHRYPPDMCARDPGWPVTYGTDYCGEFQKKNG